MPPLRPVAASRARLDHYACLVECGADLFAAVHLRDFEIARIDETHGWPGLIDAVVNRSLRDVDPLEAFEVTLGWSPDGPEDDELARLGWFLATTSTHLHAFARVIGRRLRHLARAPTGPAIAVARKEVMRGVTLVVNDPAVVRAYEQHVYRAIRAAENELAGAGSAEWTAPRAKP